MKVFISWSKPTSRKVAEALHGWLPLLVNALDPWMSAIDIDAGRKWGPEIEAQLEASKLGVLCVSPQNLTQPWLMFEAGAISKQVSQSRVIPYLFGITNADLQGPLSQFQAVSADEEGSLSLIKSINKALATPIKDAQLEKAFAAFWPELEKALATIRDEAKNEITSKAPPQRPDRELLEEMLAVVRRLDRSSRSQMPTGPQMPTGTAQSWQPSTTSMAIAGIVQELLTHMPPARQLDTLRSMAAQMGISAESLLSILAAQVRNSTDSMIVNQLVSQLRKIEE